VNSDDGVDSFDRLSSGYFDFTGSGEGLIESGMDCVEGFEVFLVRSRQGRVEGVAAGQHELQNLFKDIPRRPESIISNLGGGVELEDSSSGRLDFVGDVGMEELGSRKGVRIRSSVFIRVDHCLSAHFQLHDAALTDNIIKIATSRNSISSMFMERSEMSTKCSMRLNIERMLFSPD
jgi:hypothetical protein